MCEGASFALGPLRPPPHGGGDLLRFGITEFPAAWARGLPLLWITEGTAAWARGPPSVWDHRGPRGMGKGASFALGSPRLPPQGRRGPFRLRAPGVLCVRCPWPLGTCSPVRVPSVFGARCPWPLGACSQVRASGARCARCLWCPWPFGACSPLGSTEAPTAWARGPPSLWDHRSPRRIGEGAFPAWGPSRPPPHWREGLLRFRTIGAPASWARGPPSLWNHRGPCRMGVGASFALGPLRRVPHG